METLLSKINNSSGRNIFWVIFFIGFFQRSDLTKIELLIIGILILVIISNDYIRLNKDLNKKQVIVSNVLSNIIALVISITYSEFVFVYLCILGCEIIFYGIKEKNYLWYFNLICVILGNIFNGIVKGYIKSDLNGYIYSMFIFLMSYFCFNSMNYWYERSNHEVKKVKLLNKQLEESNLKLDEYSKQVKELTLRNERNRIGSEMHDSLGHSLTALRMQLEFCEKTVESNPNKTLEILKKSEKLVKESIIELRETVYDLKEDNRGSYIEKIQGLVDGLHKANLLHIEFNYNKKIDELNSDIKDFLYRVIKESITNSLNHGQATKVHINITYIEGIVDFALKDNGKGCNLIIENNGLRNIKERSEILGGKCVFNSKKGNGFEVRIHI